LVKKLTTSQKFDILQDLFFENLKEYSFKSGAAYQTNFGVLLSNKIK
jgi:hypothetical protein